MPVVKPQRDPPSFKERYGSVPHPPPFSSHSPSHASDPKTVTASLRPDTLSSLRSGLRFAPSPDAPQFRWRLDIARALDLEVSEDLRTIGIPSASGHAEHGASDSAVDVSWRTVVCSEPLPDRSVFTVHVDALGGPPAGPHVLWIGVASAPVATRAFLGATPNSWGFSARYGGAANKASELSYGQPYGVGDVIKVTVDLTLQTIEFAKNGASFGVAFRFVRGTCFPAVSLARPGDRVTITRVV
eukprot:TRINITY_DN4944_c0_g1_i2.p1 TRINITY_DN4944_c0_g1~~TRINITY_DN4944_c0_g1_i2.p1  ORF type:complete len:243 (+),score=27.19 TRINITY_DN4944_c0_g1_i2:145-873(+)